MGMTTTIWRVLFARPSTDPTSDAARRPPWGLVLAAGVALIGCGGSSGDDDTGSTTDKPSPSDTSMGEKEAGPSQPTPMTDAAPSSTCAEGGSGSECDPQPGTSPEPGVIKPTGPCPPGTEPPECEPVEPQPTNGGPQPDPPVNPTATTTQPCVGDNCSPTTAADAGCPEGSEPPECEPVGPDTPSRPPPDDGGMDSAPCEGGTPCDAGGTNEPPPTGTCPPGTEPPECEPI